LVLARFGFASLWFWIICILMNLTILMEPAAPRTTPPEQRRPTACEWLTDRSDLLRLTPAVESVNEYG
jgi:hypothetical protein